jgi:dihydrofolate reductase
VVSKSQKGSDDNVEYYGGDLRELTEELKSQPGKDIFVDGGGETIRALRNEGLIDDYIVSIIPVMLGRGIRLFPETDQEMREALVLRSCKSYPSGLVQLSYEKAKE